MTGNQLLDNYLSPALEDASDTRWTRTEKINALNKAQDLFMNTMPFDKLRVLETTGLISGIDGSSVVHGFSIVRDYLVSVQNTATLEFAKIIPHEEKDRTSSYELPAYLLGGNLHHSWTASATDNIALDVVYIQSPPTISANDTTITGGVTDNHYKIISDMAESILWNADNKPERSLYADQKAKAQVEAL